jgi:hypothetical protein
MNDMRAWQLTLELAGTKRTLQRCAKSLFAVGCPTRPSDFRPGSLKQPSLRSVELQDRQRMRLERIGLL